MWRSAPTRITFFFFIKKMSKLLRQVIDNWDIEFQPEKKEAFKLTQTLWKAIAILLVVLEATQRPRRLHLSTLLVKTTGLWWCFLKAEISHPTEELRRSPSVCWASWSGPPSLSPSLCHRHRKLAHLAVIAHLALQSQPAFTQTAPASLFFSSSPSIHLSLLPSLPPSTCHPSPLAFFSLSRKGDPLRSSEIKTGRCKLQINVIKCPRYHRPSYWSGCWLRGV